MVSESSQKISKRRRISEPGVILPTAVLTPFVLTVGAVALALTFAYGKVQAHADELNRALLARGCRVERVIEGTTSFGGGKSLENGKPFASLPSYIGYERHVEIQYGRCINGRKPAVNITVRIGQPTIPEGEIEENFETKVTLFDSVTGERIPEMAVLGGD